MDYKKDYAHLLNQSVKGYRNSRIVAISSEGLVAIEYELVPGIKQTDTKDLAEINVNTIADRP